MGDFYYVHGRRSDESLAYHRREHQPDRKESEQDQQHLCRGRGEIQKGERGNLRYLSILHFFSV